MTFGSAEHLPRSSVADLPNGARTAVGWVKSMRGGTQAHLVRADDGWAYVVKSPQNPQGNRVLINEWLVAGILSHLQLPTPCLMPLRITSELLDGAPELAFQTSRGRVNWSPCVALGSRFPGSVTNTAAYDYLPSTIVAEVANLSHFAGMLAVDKWVSNEDFRQAIFVRERTGSRSTAFGGAPSSKRLFAHFVDHGLAFQGAKWEFRDAPLAGKFRDSTVYSHVRGIEDFEPYLEAIGQFPADELERIVASVPPQWPGRNDQAVLSGLCRQLLGRRQRVPDLIIDARRAAPESFPRWV